jgi:hypothetical protein
MRTSKADKNLFSCSNNTYQWYAGTDRVQSVEYPPTTLRFVFPDDDADWDSPLKICDGTRGLVWTTIESAQGHENALDLNNRVTDCWLVGRWGYFGRQKGDQVITVKGGCRRIKIFGVIHSTGNEADVCVGNWSDRSFDISEDLDFSALERADGKPVTFILARCRNVKLPPGAKVLKLKSLLYSCYWWGKFAAVKAGLIR